MNTPNITRPAAAIMLLTLSLSGCQKSPESTQKTAPASAPEQKTDTKPLRVTEDNLEPWNGTETAGNRHPAVGTTIDLQAKKITDVHPNGMNITIASVQVEDTGFLLRGTVANRDVEDHRIFSEGAWLMDDKGIGYIYQDPRGKINNYKLKPGEKVDFEWPFYGKPHAGARELTLKMNNGHYTKALDMSGRSEHYPVPQFMIMGIPLVNEE